jgi:hypothetical protein
VGRELVFYPLTNTTAAVTKKSLVTENSSSSPSANKKLGGTVADLQGFIWHDGFFIIPSSKPEKNN